MNAKSVFNPTSHTRCVEGYAHMLDEKLEPDAT